MELVLPLLWLGDAISWPVAVMVYLVHWWRWDCMLNGVEHPTPGPCYARPLMRFDV